MSSSKSKRHPVMLYHSQRKREYAVWRDFKNSSDFLICTYTSFSRIAERVQLFIGNCIWVTYIDGNTHPILSSTQLNYTSNVNYLKKKKSPTPKDCTAWCLLPLVPVMDKPPTHRGPSPAALQSPCLQQSPCKRAKLPESQLQGLSFQPQALYKYELLLWSTWHVSSSVIYEIFTTIFQVLPWLKKGRGAEGYKSEKYFKFKNNTQTTATVSR